MGPKNACSYADLAMDKIDLKAKFSGPIITCDQAYFFWERRRGKGEGKKNTPDTFIERDANCPQI